MTQVPYGQFFAERGAALYTARLTDVDPAEGVVLQLPFQVSEIMIHWEAGEATGTLAGLRDGSETVHITEDGCTLTLPLARPANTDIVRIYPPGAEAANISIFAW